MSTIKTRVLARLIRYSLKLISATYRVRIVEGREFIEQRIAEGASPAILSLWHNRVFLFASFIEKEFVKKGVPIAIMSSDSKDGDMGSEFAVLAGVKSVRGSSNRNAAIGLRRMYRVMANEGRSIVILTDGSQGPVYKSKIGAVMLSRMTRCPMLPMSYWASGYWRIKSWDRMVIPKPFAKISVVIGKPLQAPENADRAILENYRSQLDAALDEAGFRAEKEFPRKD